MNKYFWYQSFQSETPNKSNEILVTRLQKLPMQKILLRYSYNKSSFIARGLAPLLRSGANTRRTVKDYLFH